jgi:O-antigen ligase
MGPALALGMALTITILPLAYLSAGGAVADQNTIMIMAGLGIFSLLAGATNPTIPLALALVFITSPIPQMVSLEWSVYVPGFLIAGCVLGILLQSSFRQAVQSDALYGKMWVFLGYGLLSAVRGLTLHNSFSYVVGDFYQLAEFAVLYILIRVLLRDKTSLQPVLKWVFASLMVTVAFQLALVALGGDTSGWLPSWEASTGSDSLARTIDINAIFALAVLLNVYSRAETSTQRLTIWLLLALTVANILMSLSRGEWLGSLVAVSVSLLLPTNYRKKRLLGAFLSVLLFFMILGAAWKIGTSHEDSLLGVFEERVSWGVAQVESGLEGDTSLATRRFIEFALIAPQIPEAPILGKGLGATYEIGGFAVLNSVSDQVVDHHFIHNLFLQMTFRMGVLGLVLYCGILVRYFRKGIAEYKLLRNGQPKAIAGGLIAGMAGMLMISMTEPVLLRHPECGFAAFAMALTFRLSSMEAANAVPHRVEAKPE